MCGIFGIVSNEVVSSKNLDILAHHAEQRGRDSSGLYFSNEDRFSLYRAPCSISKLLRKVNTDSSKFIMGHSRLITNGLSDNQPVYQNSVCVIHNGIVVNHDHLWSQLNKNRKQAIDTEIISAIAAQVIEDGDSIESVPKRVLELCKGTVACAIALPKLGKLCLFSNNGSLFIGIKDSTQYFSSERYPLTQLNCEAIEQIRNNGVILDIPVSHEEPFINDHEQHTTNLIPGLGIHSEEEKILEHQNHNVRRCTRCILPETMPYIRFDAQGICNYCHTYKPRNKPRPTAELFELVDKYRRINGDDCIIPFSGGRDSCYGLHLVLKELRMKPITYTYDWGMVTDLGRRNISRMSAQLGVENIIVADDIAQKRRNIAQNLKAWLNSPHLGMISILTAGDKHFFRHIETIKQQTGISLNLWGVNPLEVTHFKAGFLGVPPYFEEQSVYTHGGMKQLRYQWLRLNAMLHSPGYFNSSLWDTLSGEYYRSFHKKTDYFHIFDYWRWDEKIIDDVLLNEYDWETASDTKTTWRIGDGTAAFYNYVYYTVAGFTEHDTFRSNQIREGDLTREEALELALDENRPRYPNIKWYLDAVGVDFKEAIRIVNAIPKLY
ncbi:MAG: glucosamine 6-phosphate synthetase [Gammaproteobacteria bacterium]|jgi:glutamine---fructose-6-phosphate transaminase (isomerizing)|nr:glucosamine 6-phosphate synthetase [Gammaproteobacteria bacterium]